MVMMGMLRMPGFTEFLNQTKYDMHRKNNE